MPVADICRKVGISQATYFNWKKKYDGLLPTEMRQLEDENARLRKVVADLSLSTKKCCRTRCSDGTPPRFHVKVAYNRAFMPRTEKIILYPGT